MKAKQERIQQILSETILALCNNGLEFDCELEVDGLLGITLDKKDVFLVKISEVIQGAKTSLNIGSKHNYLGSPSELAVEDDGTDNGNVHATKRLCTQFRSPKRKKPEDDDEASPQDLSQRTHSPFGVKQELLSNADSNSRGSPATVVRLSSPSFGNNSHWKQPTDRSANTDEDAPQPRPANASSTNASSSSSSTSSTCIAAASSSSVSVVDKASHEKSVATSVLAATLTPTKYPMSSSNHLPFSPAIYSPASGDAPDEKPNMSPAEIMLAQNGHFPSRLPPKRKSGRGILCMQKRCRVCYRFGVRKETTYCCPKCPGQPGLCSGKCFALFHGLQYDNSLALQPFTPPPAALSKQRSPRCRLPITNSGAGRTDMEECAASAAMLTQSPQLKPQHVQCLFPTEPGEVVGKLFIKKEPIDNDEPSGNTASSTESREMEDIQKYCS